jgi:plastocyanin
MASSRIRAAPNSLTMPPVRLPTWTLAVIVPAIAAIAVVVTLTTTSDGPGGADTVATSDAIVIRNFAYTPPTLRIHAGTTITVRNTDGTAHTLTANDRSFDTGDLQGGESTSITIDEPGTYRYFCDIHNYMTGTIDAT